MYSVVTAFGYEDKPNKHRVWSNHRIMKAAIKQAKKYKTGVMIVEGNFVKNEYLFGDWLKSFKNQRIIEL